MLGVDQRFEVNRSYRRGSPPVFSSNFVIALIDRVMATGLFPTSHVSECWRRPATHALYSCCNRCFFTIPVNFRFQVTLGYLAKHLRFADLLDSVFHPPAMRLDHWLGPTRPPACTVHPHGRMHDVPCGRSKAVWRLCTTGRLQH